jgi:hypothetical protein
VRLIPGGAKNDKIITQKICSINKCQMSSLMEKYYPSYNSNTYYGLYSIPIRRFLLVDYYNIFALFNTARVLSSKINTVLFILPGQNRLPKINNDNCLRFTFQHNRFQSETTGHNIKQSPTATILRADLSVKLIKANLPAEFDDEDRRKKILETQSYAQYINSCMHAIMLTSMIYQQIYIEQEHNEYNSFLFNKPQEPTLTTKIMNILSFANDINEAQSQIKTFWLNLITENLNERIFWPEKWQRELQKHCKDFYEILGTTVPIEIQQILDNAKI